jgi:hypothetical protein
MLNKKAQAAATRHLCARASQAAYVFDLVCQGEHMSLRINDRAPDFKAQTTQGEMLAFL